MDPTRHGAHLPKTVEVRIVGANPLVLDTVYVSVERGVLEKVDEIQSRFGGGFHNYGKGRKSLQKEPASFGGRHDAPLEDRLTTLVRDGLSAFQVIHSGDIFPLSLPAHPITHVRPAPAIALECEPVSQGLISAKTKIVVMQAGAAQEKALRKMKPAPILEESLEDTAEDTSTDQFFSAAEDKLNTTASEIDGTSEDESVTESSELEHSDEDDSDSMDDLISLSAPGLPPQQAGTLSAMTAATPRPGGIRASGTHTPGSVYSSFTATTARAGGNRPGKVFRTEALLRRIPGELLHPRPGPEDDDEAVIFVDTSTLAKIGCFSGDWVRIEIARNVSSFGFPLGFGGMNGLYEEEESDWRAVRVYGLPGLLNQKPRYVVDKTGERRSSFTQTQALNVMTPVLYLSPILLSNLGNANFVKVGALPKPPRHSGRSTHLQPLIPHKSPPLAREVTLLKVSTPLTTDKQLQSTLFSQLKAHFESKKRILKKGDLIAIPVDEELGKATAVTTAETSMVEDDITVKLQQQGKANSPRTGIAWFSVQHVDADKPSEHEDSFAANNWGDVALVDSLNVRLSQAGNTVQSIPETIEHWTKYWLGLKSLPSRPSRAYDPVNTISDLPAMEKLPLEKRIADLIAAATSPRAINLGLPPLVILLYSTQRQIGKSYIATSACASVGLHTFPISCHDLLSENASSTGGGDVKTDALLQTRADRALSCGAQQTAILLQHIDSLTADRMIPTLRSVISSSRILLATTTKLDDIPDGIRSLFTHEFEVSAPNEEARELILRNASLSTSLPLSPNINLKNLALQTAALVAGDLLDVVNRAVLARSNRLSTLAEDQARSMTDITISGGQLVTHLTPLDFSTAIGAARSTFSDAIGAPKIPTVTWKDVGGLSSQKDAIMETISLPLTRPELFANGVRKRSGILFYGPPGTGKTLLAKAIATEFSLNFFSVKGPELLNMYIGESEANVRRVFQRARDARPCVVFFDELDSVAPKRGNQGDSGGVMDRIVSQLLAELDGMSGGGSKDGEDGGQSNAGGGVFVIGATNRPDLLDPALLRPGRFDKMLYLGVADSHESQVTIMEALTRKFTLDPSVDLKRVANQLPFTYTGADLYALCSDAMLKAITRKTQSVDEKVKKISQERGEDISTGWFFDHLATEEDVQVVVNEEDFLAAQRELVGSVSAKELEHFERIRGLFEEMDIGSDTSAAKKPVANVASSAPARITPIMVDRTDDSITPSINKGKGKQREIPHAGIKSNAIANPDSGLESEGDLENDYGVSAGEKGQYTNGSIDVHTNGIGPDTGIGNGKGKARADEFQDDVGGDEDLYD